MKDCVHVSSSYCMPTMSVKQLMIFLSDVFRTAKVNNTATIITACSTLNTYIKSVQVNTYVNVVCRCPPIYFAVFAMNFYSNSILTLSKLNLPGGMLNFICLSVNESSGSKLNPFMPS